MNRPLRNQTPERYSQGSLRTPLYPLGPSLNHTAYQPIYELPKKFPSFTNNSLPSYQQRLVQRQTQLSRTKIPREELERQLISSNEAEVENQNRRRRLAQDSYVREIERIQIILAKNSERKEKLKSEIQLLQGDSLGLRQKVDSEKEGMPRYQVTEGLERKQLQVIELKTQMLNDVGAKEKQMLRQRQQEEAEWEQKIKGKHQILIAAEQKRNGARNQLQKGKRQLDTEVRETTQGVSDIARGRKYQEFKYDFDVLKEKALTLNGQRLASNREVDLTKHSKNTIVRDQIIRLEDLKKLRAGLEQNNKEIDLRNKQLERTNQNLEVQNARKQALVIQYESDIQETRARAGDNDAQINAKLNQFRSRPNEGLFQSLSGETEEVKRNIDEVQKDNFRLRADFKKLSDYLESEVTKSIYQTFNELRVS